MCQIVPLNVFGCRVAKVAFGFNNSIDRAIHWFEIFGVGLVKFFCVLATFDCLKHKQIQSIIAIVGSRFMHCNQDSTFSWFCFTKLSSATLAPEIGIAVVTDQRVYVLISYLDGLTKPDLLIYSAKSSISPCGANQISNMSLPPFCPEPINFGNVKIQHKSAIFAKAHNCFAFVIFLADNDGLSVMLHWARRSLASPFWVLTTTCFCAKLEKWVSGKRQERFIYCWNFGLDKGVRW